MFRLLVTLVAFISAFRSAEASRQPRNPAEQTLADLGDGPFRVLTNDAFPDYRVRVKQIPKSAGFCDSTVGQYAGYIDIRARHFFFYYFESRNDPATDDVVMWLNGGPGASASVGLFSELGPCNVISDNTTEFNPHSWNSKANLIFLDQPIGVGFSYADFGEAVRTTEEAAVDIARFLAIFFESMPGLKNRALHIAGESYAGRYIPLFAAQVFDQNELLIKEGIAPVNLSSIAVGNGVLESIHSITSQYDIQCKPVVGLPLQSIRVCTEMKQALPRCEMRLRRACIETFDLIECQAARGFCHTAIAEPFALTGKSPYDMRTVCIGDVRDTLCYPITQNITHFLNLPRTRDLLSIDRSFGEFAMVDWTLNTAFGLSGDVYRPSAPYIEALLERNIRVLLYAGIHDFSCNFIGMDRVSRGLEWHGQRQFTSQPLRPWFVEHNVAGQIRSSGLLTFATVENAGHQVPHDEPVNSLAMINRWLKNTL